MSGPTDQYTTIGNPRPACGFILHHTDAEREFAYDRQSSFGKLDKALEARSLRDRLELVRKSSAISCTVASRNPASAGWHATASTVGRMLDGAAWLGA